MPRYFTRRDLLKMAGGGGAALLLSPVPWKLLDDAAIWTQNWSWVPRPKKGPINYRTTSCTLCPAGCGVKLRCVRDQPVAAAGVRGHPISMGALCPLGIGLHHLPYHPRRLTGPAMAVEGGGGVRLEPISVEAAGSRITRAIRERGDGGRVVFLDQRPGRAVSERWQRFMSALDETYVAEAGPERQGLETLASMAIEPSGSLGYDLERARWILSFGAPILDGWGAPGHMMALRSAGVRMIQVDSSPSRTAGAADSWLRIAPGTEAVLALGIANVLIGEGLVDVSALGEIASDLDMPGESGYRDLVARFSPQQTARICDISAESVTATARAIARERGVVVGGGEHGGGPLPYETELAVEALNILVGSLGRPGGVLERPAAPWETEGAASAGAKRWRDVEDESIAVLILGDAASGAALPWSVVEPKLREDALVVSLATHAVGLHAHATLHVPAPAFLEGWQEVATPPTSAATVLAASAPVLTAPEGAIEPAKLVSILAAELGLDLPRAGAEAARELIDARAEAVIAAGRGEVFRAKDGTTVPASTYGSARALVRDLGEGAVWRDDVSGKQATPASRLMGEAGFQGMLAAATEPRPTLSLMPFGLRGSVGDAPATPLLVKLYRESRLREAPGTAIMHPNTAARHRVRAGRKVRLETEAGSAVLTAMLDPRVREDAIHVAVGPGSDIVGEPRAENEVDILRICTRGANRAWRAVQVTVKEA